MDSISGQYWPTPPDQGSTSPIVPVQVDKYGRLLSGGLGPVPPTPPATSSYTQAALSFASSGDNTAISGTALQTIRVFKVALALASGTTLTFKDGSAAALTGAMTLGAMVLDSADGSPLFITTAGNGFVVNLGAAIQCSGAIWYTKS